jgi:hypothetical protein
MFLYVFKTVFAFLLLAAGCGAFFTMMARFGRPGDEARSERLRRRHKAFGWAFVWLLLPLVVGGGIFLVQMGNGLTIRGGLHFLLAVSLLAVLLLKVLAVKTHRQMMSFARSLGMAVFAVTVVIFLMMAGWFVLLTAAGK